MEKWQLAIENFLNEYKNEDYFVGAILTGSYATGNQNINSDIDIYIITKNTPLDKIKPLFLLNCNMCYRSLPL